MLKNYFNIAFRTLKANLLFTALNIFGLGFGIACVILIGLWVYDEYSYDKFHSKINRLHLLVQEISAGTNKQYWANSPAPLAPVLIDQIPEIEHALRVNHMQNNFKVGDNKAKMSGLWVDSIFFDVFDFELIVGDKQSSLSQPSNIILSSRLALSLYNYTDVINKTVTVIDNNVEEQYVVSGVLEELPNNSSLEFDYLIPSRNFYTKRPYYEKWGNFNGPIYISLEPGAQAPAVEEKVKGLIRKNNEGTSAVTHFYPFEDVYLKGDFTQGLGDAGKIIYVRILIVVGVVLLIIAIINFVNLTTALADKRGKEVGVRKTVGAVRAQLVPQFLIEAIIVTFISFVAALVLSSMLMPVFSSITGKALSIPITNINFILLLFAGAFLIGVFAGLYPAYYLSGIGINESIKKSKSNKPLTRFRVLMVVFQFALSIALIIGSLFIKNQVDFFMGKDMGLKTNNVLYHPNYDISDKTEAYEQQLRKIPGVKNVAYASFSPLHIGNTTYSVTWDGGPEDNGLYFHTMHVDENFIDLFDLQLVEGKGFLDEFNGENIEFVLNETAVKSMMVADPIGMKMKVWGIEGTIVGVVEDFHHHNLAQNIEPVIMFYEPNQTSRCFINIESENLATTIPEVEKVFNSFNPSYSFEYSFLDEDLAKEYNSIISFGNLVNTFSWVTIIIACLGLFGLSAYLMAQRRKETGIRKALGATKYELFVLFSKDFVKLIVIAFIVAVPVTIFLINDWLNGFAYRIDLGVIPILIGGLASIIIATLSVTYNILRTSYVNPTSELRSE